MFFLFYPNAAYPLSLLLFPVTKVIHVPGCWFIHNETFIVHSAALLPCSCEIMKAQWCHLFLVSLFVLTSWDNECDRTWELLALLGVPSGGACTESGLLQPIQFFFLWSFKPVTFNMPQLSTLTKMRLCSKGTLWLIRKCLSRKVFLLLFGVPSMW